MTLEPFWLTLARRDIGLREIPGAPTAPRIRQWLEDLKAWWRDDETPWCGVAMAAWMRQAGIAFPREWYRAKAWLDWGIPIHDPATGSIVVFDRKGGGHVALVVARDTNGRLLCLGGNQGDEVNIRTFPRDRVLGYRWPREHVAELPRYGYLPLVVATAPVSRNEA